MTFGPDPRSGGLALDAATPYRGDMDKLRILSAAATLDAFTVQLLETLSGGDKAAVEQIVDALVRQHRLIARKPSGKVTVSEPIYGWTTGGAMAVRAEIEAGYADRSFRNQLSYGKEVERYEDPFTSALDVTRRWVEDAEGSSDQTTMTRNLSMAGAEIRTLRHFLRDQPTSSVEQIEELARRLELLASRPPVEAYRSKVLKSVLDALRVAGEHVPLQRRDAGTISEDAEMAFVFNATRSAPDTAQQVGRTVEQFGGTCVIFQMADATPKRRKRAFEALSGFFTGPGSAKTKVFIIIDSSGDAKSKMVLNELATFFGSSEQLTNRSEGGADDGTNGSAWSLEPRLFLSAIASPSDDWLPRGLLKHLVLQTYLDRSAAGASQDLARVALNDPVVFDCVSAGFHRTSATKTHFAYHRVEMDFDRYAVIRGLVRGSFTGTAASAGTKEPGRNMRLLTSGS